MLDTSDKGGCESHVVGLYTSPISRVLLVVGSDWNDLKKEFPDASSQVATWVMIARQREWQSSFGGWEAVDRRARTELFGLLGVLPGLHVGVRCR